MSKIRIFSLGGLNEDGKNMYIVASCNPRRSRRQRSEQPRQQPGWRWKSQ